MEELDFNQCARPASSVLMREVDGESVLVNLDKARFYGLDPIGTRIWHHLTTLPTVGDAFTAVLSEYEVEPSELRVDLAALIDELCSQDLIELQPPLPAQKP